MEEEAPKIKIIRRDIAGLKECDAKIYYYCLYFQIFMKPLIKVPKGEDGKDTFFIRYPMTCKIVGNELRKTTEYARVYPKNHYDTYITSHSNCCEHVSEFFPYYHRNLQMNF